MVSGCITSKQMVVQCATAPLAEDLSYVSQKSLGLVPALRPGQDELRSAAMHQTMFVVCPTQKLCGQQQQEKQQVDSL